MNEQPNYLSLDALISALDAAKASGEQIAITPTAITITRDQVKRYGTPEALAQWDAQFPHGNTFSSHW